MKKNIVSKMTSEHYQWGDKCDSWVFVDTIGLSVKQESMPAGTQEKIHFHRKAQQFFFILKGTATFYVEAKKIQLAEQEGFSIEPETKHFIANETNENLEFLVISQPSSNDDRIIIE